MDNFRSLKIKKLVSNPYDYEFPKAVHVLNKLLQSFCYKTGNDFSGINIYFKSTVRYTNPASDVDKIEFSFNTYKTSNQKIDYFSPVLWVNFTGIAGIQGPLALIYTEKVFRETRAGKKIFARFLDIFNHRIISLFYEAPKSIPGYSDEPPQKSIIGGLLKAFGGIDQSEENEESWNDYTKYLITYKSMFWQRVRSTINLKQMLQNFLNTKIHISEFVGNFFNISDKEVTKIGRLNGNLITLGRDSVLGDRVWRQNTRINITVLEVDFKTYETFNPYKNGKNLEHLLQICKSYIPAFIRTQFFIKIDQKFKKKTILMEKHHLGFDTWLGTKIIENEQARMIARVF
ncbi:MAG: type VI secretion system baseplate subunit TssG [Holosporales bacterium]|jgi:type VI secretion system protein ImpH|nr:type VI secretion system baseplate subunit TssG [Holosporales bacterium]